MVYGNVGYSSKHADPLSEYEQLLRTLSLDKADATLDLLEKITRNVIHHPSEERYRRIRKANDQFAMLLGSPGALLIMEEMGWQVEDDFLVLPAGVNLDFQKHVVKIMEAKAHYAKEREEAKRTAKLAKDPDKAEMLRQLELDRRERAATADSGAFPVSPAAPAGTPAITHPTTTESPARFFASASAVARSTDAPAAPHGPSPSRPPAPSLPPAHRGQNSESASILMSDLCQFEVGDEAEVEILDGRHAGNWARCRIKGPGARLGFYNIYLLPTTDFDSVGGFAGTEVRDIDSQHLRRPRARSRSGPCSFDSCAAS